MRKIRVFIIDDAAAMRRLIAEALAADAELEIAGSAENGRVALDRIAHVRPDVLVLDLEMPVMGGLAACTAIRAWERDRGLHVPIVAMTAHAMQGDEQRCLDAGMDDYISKPIDIDRLVTVLGKISPAATAPAPVTPHEELPAPTADDIDVDLALSRIGNDRKLMSDIIGLFMAQCPKAIADLEAALAARDSEQVFQVAHKFKGSAGSIAAQRTAELALAVEKAGRSGDLAAAAEHASRLKSSVERLQLQLADVRQSLRAEATGT